MNERGGVEGDGESISLFLADFDSLPPSQLPPNIPQVNWLRVYEIDEIIIQYLLIISSL